MTDSDPTLPDPAGAGAPPPPPPPPPTGAAPDDAASAPTAQMPATGAAAGAAGVAGAATVWDLIVADDDLNELQTLVENGDPSVRAMLADPSERLTVFAPNNAAIAAARASGSFAGTDVTQLLLAHVDSTDALYTANLFDGTRTDVSVTRGAPQPIDQGARTVGGAAIVAGDATASNGVMHTVSRVFTVQSPVPWYKTPLGIAAIVLLLLALLGLIAWLIWGGDDDDEASSTSSALVLETRDFNGDPLDVGFIVAVQGPAGAETAFNWLRPAATPGEPVAVSSGSNGRIVFEWEPQGEVDDSTEFESTVTGVTNVPPGWIPPGPVVDCVLEPLEGQSSTVSMNIALESADDTVDRTAAFDFPNFTFSLGDTVSCTLDAAATAPTTSSTVVPTTTPGTTTPATTTPATTAPATTAPATTAPATTAPATTTPPTTPATAREALVDAGDYGDFLDQVDQVPAAAALLDGNGPVTVFAPIDSANVSYPTDPDDLEELLLSHIVDGESLDAAAVTGATEVTVATGGTQPVDGAASPPTIGGVDIIAVDIASDSGFSHGIDGAMPPAPAP